jgi:uncharacterized protein (DUF362 family)
VERRFFLQLAAAAPLVAGPDDQPVYRVVTPFERAAKPAMPGPYPGHVTRVHSENSIDPQTDAVNRQVVQQMLAAGMQALTGERRPADAWARFIAPNDVVGIKINCSGAPQIRSSPEVVAGIVENVMAVGVPAKQIFIYERFADQGRSVNYPKYLPSGVNVLAAEGDFARGSVLGYDPHTYVETSFFGEDDTRSNMVRLVTDRLTKIINVPNAKEHQASGVTGCLKNIAYGNFSNVARSHESEKTFTYSFIGRLASVEPLPSRVVLHIMDGLAGVWHAGPFSRDRKFRFYPKQLMFGTDPVAMDHKLIDLIEAKRKAEGAISIFDRSREHLGDNRDPNFNHYIREPGHVEYASKLGLGVFDNSKITLQEIEL